MNKLDFIKHTFCFKEYHQENEKATEKLKEMLSNHVSNMGPALRIYKELLQLEF